MALFPAFEEEYKVYGKVIVNEWTDPTIMYKGMVRGILEPVTSTQEFLNKQDNQGITEVIVCDLEYEGVVNPDDYLRDPRGVQYQCRGVPEAWRYIMPNLVIKTERAQHVIDVSGL